MRGPLMTIELQPCASDTLSCTKLHAVCRKVNVRCRKGLIYWLYFTVGDVSADHWKLQATPIFPHFTKITQLRSFIDVVNQVVNFPPKSLLRMLYFAHFPMPMRHLFGPTTTKSLSRKWWKIWSPDSRLILDDGTIRHDRRNSCTYRHFSQERHGVCVTSASIRQ